MQKVFSIFIFFILALSAFASETNNWDQLDSKTLSLRLEEFQKNAPDKALSLADYMMKRFPDAEAPYNAAASIYTIRREKDKAEEIYLAAIKNVPANDGFYLRLANFYNRLQPEKFAPMIEVFRQSQRQRKDYSFLLARLYLVGGKEVEAIGILREAYDQGDKSPALIKILFNLLMKQGNLAEAQSIMISRLTSPDVSPELRLEFMNILLDSDYGDVRQVAQILDSVISLIQSYPQAKKAVNEALHLLEQKKRAKAFADAIENDPAKLKTSDNYFWMLTLALQKVGENRNALSYLKNYEGKNSMILEEKARLLSQTDGETTAALSVWRELGSLNPNDSRIQLTIAQFMNLNEMNEESQKILEKVNPDDLKDQLLFLYFAINLDNLARLQRFSEVVSIWQETGRRCDTARLMVFKDAIFRNLPETNQHKSLMEALNQKMAQPAEQKTTDTSFLLLKIFLSEELREFDLYFQTADKFLSSQQQFDADLIYPFVRKAIGRGVQIASPPEENNEPEYAVGSEPYLAFAEKYLEQLIQKQPQIPDYYRDLLFIARARKNDAPALERVKKLLKGKETDPEANHQLAYILSQSGYASMALPYYEKAIALAPERVKYRINYAGGLTRMGQYQRAIQIYKEAVADPSSAREWDITFIIDQINGCYEKMGKKDEAPTLIEKWMDSAPLKASDSIYDAWYHIAELYIAQNKFDNASKVFKKMQGIFAADRIRLIDCLYNQGDMERRKGNFKEALKQWRELAEKYPDDAGAQNALMSAAYLAENDFKDSALSLTLYKRFLEMKPLDADNVRHAEKKIKQLSEKNH